MMLLQLPQLLLHPHRHYRRLHLVANVREGAVGGEDKRRQMDKRFPVLCNCTQGLQV